MAMTNQQKNFLALIIIILLIGATAVYIYKDLNKSDLKPPTQPTKDEQRSVSIETDQSNQGSYKVEVVDDVNNNGKTTAKTPKMPKLDLPVVNYSHIDDAAFEIAAKNIGILAEELKKNPKNELNWLNLAIFRKMLGDYQASVEILNYVAILWPNDYVPRNNLADLYQFYLKNYPLAEENWLKTIELKPDYIPAYENLYNLYIDLYKEKQTLALPILFQGLKNNPKNIDLMLYTARHYRSIGDKNESVNYYTKAVDEAKLQKNEKLETSIRFEIAEALK